jgi:YcaO-like protein with predicted kinase domain
MEHRLAEPALKGFRSGTHRLIAPGETIERVLRYAPIMGITRVADITGLDTVGLPTVMVCRPNGRSLSVSQGKGLTLDAARASGLMESVESFHAERVLHPLKLASYEELRYTHRTTDVTALPQYNGSRFHPQLPILWVEGFDLIQREHVWVPFDCVHCDYTARGQTLESGFICSSNGLASGNHLLEAIVHGLWEVIERDVRARWMLRDQAARDATRVDPASIDDSDCRLVLDRLDHAGVAVAIWDVASDAGIPCFTCSIIDREEHPLRPLFGASGSGCHAVRSIALLRALTEAAQARLTLITGACWSRSGWRAFGQRSLPPHRGALTRVWPVGRLIPSKRTSGGHLDGYQSRA